MVQRRSSNPNEDLAGARLGVGELDELDLFDSPVASYRSGFHGALNTSARPALPARQIFDTLRLSADSLPMFSGFPTDVQRIPYRFPTKNAFLSVVASSLVLAALPGPQEVNVMPKAEPKAERFLCKRCNRRIRVPEGWSFGPAVRKHYWAKHPEIMQTQARARSGK